MSIGQISGEAQYLEWLNSLPTAILYISKNHCGVCESLKPKMKNLIEKYPLFHFIELNSDQSPWVISQMQILSAPLILVVVEGKEISRFSRNLAIYQVEELLERYSQLMQ